MAWQQDLHQLEQDLAAGRLSAEDYRRRRDELLAAANGEQTQSANPPGQQQQQQPGAAPQTPFPPAFRWGSQPPTGNPPTGNPPTDKPQTGNEVPAVERTQTIRPVGQQPASAGQSGNPGEATQVVSGVGRPQDAERTQVVRNTPAGGFPPPPGAPVPPWQTSTPQQGGGYTDSTTDNAPNWAVNDAFGDWPRQGPEVFASSGSGGGGGGGKRIALIALIVVVVAGLGVGGWLLFGRGGSSQAGQTNPTATTSAPPTTPPPRAEIGSLAFAPGIPSAQSFTPAQLVEQKKLPQPDLDILANTTLTKADSVLSTDGSTVIDLWAFTVQDSAAAQGLAKAFDTDQLRFSFTPTNIKTSDGQYMAYTSQQPAASGATNVVYRLHYVVGNQVIRVEAFGPDGAKARADFLKVLSLQTKLTPPSQ
ncbi:MAG TPA: hypothetical protein VHX38_36515 [Pseudonocardiaceae bacterium]|nr:hypothetical protein [Pseudonocardiaceae bacterium]